MPPDSESPYPANAVFGVHKGFKPGAYATYKEFRAQTAGYVGGKEVWAVFTDMHHATEYAKTGVCPVPPIAEKKAAGAVPVLSSGLPTPDASPETENPPPNPTARPRTTTSVPLTASTSLPPPAPRKAPAAQPDSDTETEPEEDYKPVSSSLPVPGVKSSQGASERRPYKSGSITKALQRHASLNGGTIPGAQSPSPTKNVVHASPEIVIPSTAPAAPVTASSRQTRHVPIASGSGLRMVPPASAPVAVPPRTPAPAPAPSVAPVTPELPRQPRPHGTYEQCHHCDGKGWLFTPAQPTGPIPPPQPMPIQTPTRPRPTPTTKLKLVQTSDSEGTSGSAVSRTRTPSGSRLRVASIGGVGPERTPKRDTKRAVSDSVAGRRMRIVSDGAKDKGKGRAIEPMDVDPSESEAGPSAYNYM